MSNMQAMIFGIVDNGIMLLGALFGLSIEAYLPRPFRKGMGAIYGGAIGSDPSILIRPFINLDNNTSVNTLFHSNQTDVYFLRSITVEEKYTQWI
jgi:hypothetical protein